MGRVWSIVLPNVWHRDRNWPNAVGNVETKDLLGATLQKPLISKKKNAISMTCSKMRCACTYINILIDKVDFKAKWSSRNKAGHFAEL